MIESLERTIFLPLSFNVKTLTRQKHGPVVIVIFNLNANSNRVAPLDPFAFPLTRFPSRHDQLHVGLLLSIQLRRVVQSQGSGDRVDGKCAGCIFEGVNEPPVLLISVIIVSFESHNLITPWKILHDGHVVVLELESGRVVVEIFHEHLDRGHGGLERVVHLSRLDLHNESGLALVRVDFAHLIEQPRGRVDGEKAAFVA